MLSVALCASIQLQGATIKEIEQQKKAEEAKRTTIPKSIGKYVLIDKDDYSNTTELLSDIPVEKKDILMKAIYFSNIANDYDKRISGHVYDERVSKSSCEYVIKYTYEKYPEDTPQEAKKFADFSSDYGFVDTCIFNMVYSIAYEYQHDIDPKYLNKHYVRLQQDTHKRFNEKKAFVKWLQDIKFYDYII